MYLFWLKECYDMIERSYKFYFSLENSYCQDYTTEKLYNILKINTIPVVYGRINYTKHTPPHSVINIEDFGSVIELTDYLKYLDKNVTAYLEYFDWKKDYYVEYSSLSVCQLCKKLNEESHIKTVYDDLDTYWRGKHHSICKTNKNLPKIVSDNIGTY